MATTVIFSGNDRISEAHALLEALAEWLQAQPEQPLRPASAHLDYTDDGSLRGVVVTVDEAD
ncbi:hypothetical protein NVV94_19995 [Pseudomonas sp. LS1212]|uniref:hypothetical protein n=1 Tax=Pseudomonas sp. LS1212 TaxID=2972478 RepID=UPI00215D0040|nr:hypothetical protein [Pseudomonas sp. LS1212]UVJ42856.1 hypothetical protein NVV94_19995 [Pseudomonas sp. LS1212]